MTHEVGRLHRERQVVQNQIADLFAFYTKQKQAGEAVSNFALFYLELMHALNTLWGSHLRLLSLSVRFRFYLSIHLNEAAHIALCHNHAARNVRMLFPGLATIRLSSPHVW